MIIGPAGVTSKSVLIVDDDVALTRVLDRVLSAAGYAVTTINDSREAIALIEANSYDVILTDIQMPTMTGVDLLRLVRAHDLDVPVVLMTGNPTVQSAIEALGLGALQYMLKPVPQEELLRVVERASRLHEIARLKRASLELLGERSKEAGDRAGLEASLERALGSLWMAFQPIIQRQTGRRFGFEALMRTRESSLPHPGAVIEAAERLGRLPELGRTIRDTTAAAFAAAPADAVLFINLHTLDLLDPALYEDSPLRQIAERVVLEITERSTIDDVKDAYQRVSQLRGAGFRVAIDDLGAGYAGLSSFAALEPEIVKLDMSLIRGVHSSPIRQRVVRSMITLCNDMNIQVVAEGIEEQPEHDCIAAMGCDLLQGYLYGRPSATF